MNLHSCPLGCATTHAPELFDAWERLPADLRTELVNTIVELDHITDTKGWTAREARSDLLAVRDRILDELAHHPTVKAHAAKHGESWVRGLAQTVAEGVRDRCLFCIAVRPATEQLALPERYAAPKQSPKPAAPRDGVLPIPAALTELRKGIAGLRGR